MRESKKYPRGATRKGAPCKHCGSTDKYLSSRRCVNFYGMKGHSDMVYIHPPLATEKACRSCGVVKPVGEYQWREASQRYRSECKACRSLIGSCSHYGITTDHYRSLLSQQDHRCAICKIHVDDVEHSTFTRLVIDHNHTTGEVRGLLCATCNSGLGHFHDNVTKLQSAINYLSNN